MSDDKETFKAASFFNYPNFYPNWMTRIWYFLEEDKNFEYLGDEILIKVPFTTAKRDASMKP
ncbi:hypothetical protein [Paenibacillus sp. ISL-20]|uniref:hypothetical protein n=1 Tax=Paenibacillus sp. ISL-20 TaxID=2819163 RepID=UPI001BEBE329|nr:hypothetical protein [Paenibacillus sp. ISL-20]